MLAPVRLPSARRDMRSPPLASCPTPPSIRRRRRHLSVAFFRLSMSSTRASCVPAFLVPAGVHTCHRRSLSSRMASPLLTSRTLDTTQGQSRPPGYHLVQRYVCRPCEPRGQAATEPRRPCTRERPSLRLRTPHSACRAFRTTRQRSVYALHVNHAKVRTPPCFIPFLLPTCS
jgi:hypothetical protein